MTNVAMELVRELENAAEQSPLAAARVHRRLTVEEAARRAGITTDEARWLEEGRVYRFPSPDHALLSALLYASSLGIQHREALELAGRPVPPRAANANPLVRAGVLAAIALTLVALLLAVVAATRPAKKHATTLAQPTLPAPWAIPIDVRNGAGDINGTRQMASRIQSLGYRIQHVGRADNFGYRQTTVYFEPGGRALAERLARQLCVPVAPLPNGSDAHRLVVIVGPTVVSSCG
jgi:transcriptional regulator with XRE-family HTH domain